MQKIKVQGTAISVNLSREEDYISLTDIARHKDTERTDDIVRKLDQEPQHHRVFWHLGAVEQPGF